MGFFFQFIPKGFRSDPHVSGANATQNPRVSDMVNSPVLIFNLSLMFLAFCFKGKYRIIMAEKHYSERKHTWNITK